MKNGYPSMVVRANENREWQSSTDLCVLIYITRARDFLNVPALSRICEVLLVLQTKTIPKAIENRVHTLLSSDYTLSHCVRQIAAF